MHSTSCIVQRCSQPWPTDSQSFIRTSNLLRVILPLCFRSILHFSVVGPQQGDPKGPLLFCNTRHPLLLSLELELNLVYLDDLTLSGPGLYGLKQICRRILEDIHLSNNPLFSDKSVSSDTAPNTAACDVLVIKSGSHNKLSLTHSFWHLPSRLRADISD